MSEIVTDHLSLIPTEPLSSEVKRIAGNILNRASEHVHVADKDIDSTIHELRKRCKELRALVRVVRDEFGERAYHMENAIFRDTARTLSGVRDNAVLLNVIPTLIEQPKAALITNGLRGIQLQLQDRYNNELKRVLANSMLEQIEDMLESSRNRVEIWPLREKDFTSFRAGTQRVYRRGLRGMLRARAHPTVENLHEWRKRVKYLWYHVRILTPTWPTVLAGFAEALHALSDLLGDDHDLAVLTETLRTNPSIAPHYIMPDLIALIGQRRNGLQQRIWPLGVRIYAESPSNFVSKMETYWRAGARGQRNMPV